MKIKLTTDKYLFWAQIEVIANNLDNLTEYRGRNWLGNLCFKEDLDDNIKIFDNLLENKELSDFKIKLEKLK